jgi:hypothetical protein
MTAPFQGSQIWCLEKSWQMLLNWGRSWGSHDGGEGNFTYFSQSEGRRRRQLDGQGGSDVIHPQEDPQNFSKVIKLLRVETLRNKEKVFGSSQALEREFGWSLIGSQRKKEPSSDSRVTPLPWWLSSSNVIVCLWGTENWLWVMQPGAQEANTWTEGPVVGFAPPPCGNRKLPLCLANVHRFPFAFWYSCQPLYTVFPGLGVP